MNIRDAKKRIMKLYGGFGWPTIFTYIRLFLTAPVNQLEPYVPKSGFIVDLGCGYGILANLLGMLSEERTILGMDLDDYKMRYAGHGIKNVEFKVADITSTDMPPADSILLIHVLHHLNSLKEQEVLLGTCLKKLKTGGKLLIVEIDRSPWWKFVLTQIADHMLYPGDKIYYRFPQDMLPLLENLSLEVETRAMHHGTPFSHITYICTKK